MHRFPFVLNHKSNYAGFLVLNMPICTALDFLEYINVKSFFMINENWKKININLDKIDTTKCEYKIVIDAKLELFNLLGQKYKKQCKKDRDEEVSFEEFDKHILRNKAKYENEFLAHINDEKIFSLAKQFYDFILQPKEIKISIDNLSTPIRNGLYSIYDKKIATRCSNDHYRVDDNTLISTQVACRFEYLNIGHKTDDNNKLILNENIEIIDNSFTTIVNPGKFTTPVKEAYILLMTYKKLQKVYRKNGSSYHVLPDLDEIRIRKDSYSYFNKEYLDFTNTLAINKLIDIGIAKFIDDEYMLCY